MIPANRYRACPNGLVVPAEYVSSNRTENSTTISVPTHQAGDLLIFLAWRANATSPGLAAGCTNLAAWSGTLRSGRIGYKYAASGSETSGTWSSSQQLSVLVYRNAQIGVVSTANTNSYPALSGFTVNALLARFGGGAGAAPSTPSGFTSRQERYSVVYGAHRTSDTNGPYGATSIGAETLTGPSQYQLGATFAIEPAA